MWRALIVLVAFGLIGCAQIPPSAQDTQAKRFEAVPGKSVIYIVRYGVGPALGDTLYLTDEVQITTWTGTYYRWETDPGQHRISGMGVTTAEIKMTTEPGKIYFVLHRVKGTDRDGVQVVNLEPLDEKTGRALVQQAQLI